MHITALHTAPCPPSSDTKPAMGSSSPAPPHQHPQPSVDTMQQVQQTGAIMAGQGYVSAWPFDCNSHTACLQGATMPTPTTTLATGPATWLAPMAHPGGASWRHNTGPLCTAPSPATHMHSHTCQMHTEGLTTCPWPVELNSPPSCAPAPSQGGWVDHPTHNRWGTKHLLSYAYMQPTLLEDGGWLLAAAWHRQAWEECKMASCPCLLLNMRTHALCTTTAGPAGPRTHQQCWTAVDSGRTLGNAYESPSCSPNQWGGGQAADSSAC